MSALSRKVLVVDDDPVVGRSFDRVLSEDGYEVSTARDGAEALARIGGEDYDVVFTDIKMPGMDGIEVAKRIRAARPWVPVVIITGYGTPENRASAEAAGVAGFVDKPLSPEAIERSTRAALRVIQGGAGQTLPEPTAAEAALLAPAPAAAPPVAAEPAAGNRGMALAKSIGMLLAAPFIGLAYVIALPLVIVGAAAWMALKPLARPARAALPFLRNAGLFFAAPFVGLLYVVAFPFIGAGMLIHRAYKNLTERPARQEK